MSCFAWITTLKATWLTLLYAIQGPGAFVIEGVEGCYYNVVGLPLNALERLFQRLGRSLLREPALRRDA